jgi:hypothetical protein
VHSGPPGRSPLARWRAEAVCRQEFMVAKAVCERSASKSIEQLGYCRTYIAMNNKSGNFHPTSRRQKATTSLGWFAMRWAATERMCSGGGGVGDKRLLLR